MKKYVLLFVVAGMAITSCTKDAENSTGISDASLISMASSDDMALKRSTIQNENVQWNIKMNSIASKAYAEGVKNFPVNSMIVKEKRDVNGAVTGYDMMYKAPGDPNADGGWVYSSVNGHGQVVGGVDTKGTACRNCHQAATKSELH